MGHHIHMTYFVRVCQSLTLPQTLCVKDGIPGLLGFRVSDPTGLGFNLCVVPAL